MKGDKHGKGYKRDSIRHGTRSAYINRYNARIREVIGGMPVGDVKPMHCQMVINQSANAGECEESMKKTRVIMKAIFEAAVDNMMIEKNPVTKIVKIPRREKKERRVLAKSEQDRFVEMAKDSAHYDEYRFVLETGVRCGELCGLLWKNVDLKNRRISIEHSLEYRTDIQEFVNNPPKSSSGYRMISLTKTAYNILVNRQESQKHMEIPEEYQGLVFLNCNGNPTHRGIYNRALKQIAKDMDVPSFSMHSLRHTFATRCIEAGVRPKSLQKLMGHSEIGITMDLYVHATDEEAVNEMRKLETYFSSDSGETEESDE